MSELALGPLEASATVVAPASASDRPLVRLRAEIRVLEDELGELERRTAEAERRLEAEDLASPFARRAAELGSALALDIVEQGRAEIRGLLAESRVVAEARTAAALRDASEVLAAARAEVAAAMLERAASVEAQLVEPPLPLLSPTSSLLDTTDGVVSVPAPVPVDLAAAPAPPPEPITVAPSAATTTPDPATVMPDRATEMGTALADDQEPAGPGTPAHSGHGSASVVGLLEASLVEFAAVPLGAPVDAGLPDVAAVPETATPAPAMGAPPLTDRHGDEIPGPAAGLAHLPAPPDAVEAPEEEAHEVFADLAEPDSVDPFAGDTPATTSEHIEALADLGSTQGDSVAAVDGAAGPAAGSLVSPVPVVGGSGAGSAPVPGGSDAEIARDRSFWDEQEAAKRRRWLRPVEIVVPMVLALVLFVVLLLWVG